MPRIQNYSRKGPSVRNLPSNGERKASKQLVILVVHWNRKAKELRQLRQDCGLGITESSIESR